MCFECAPWTQCAYLRSILLCLQFTFGKWKWKYKHHSKLYFFNWNYESVDLHRIQFLLQNISNWFCSICFDSSICDIWTLDCSEMMFQAMIFYFWNNSTFVFVLYKIDHLFVRVENVQKNFKGPRDFKWKWNISVFLISSVKRLIIENRNKREKTMLNCVPNQSIMWS